MQTRCYGKSVFHPAGARALTVARRYGAGCRARGSARWAADLSRSCRTVSARSRSSLPGAPPSARSATRPARSRSGAEIAVIPIGPSSAPISPRATPPRAARSSTPSARSPPRSSPRPATSLYGPRQYAPRSTMAWSSRMWLAWLGFAALGSPARGRWLGSHFPDDIRAGRRSEIRRTNVGWDPPRVQRDELRLRQERSVVRLDRGLRYRPSQSTVRRPCSDGLHRDKKVIGGGSAALP